MEPANNLALGQQLGYRPEQLRLVPVTLVRGVHLGEEIRDEIVRILRAEEAPLLGVLPIPLARFVQQLMPDKTSRAKRATSVAGRRLNPDVLKRALAQQPA